MIRSLSNSKYCLLMGALVLLVALSAAGCGTTFLEKSGNMPNQNTSKHVKGYQPNDSDAIRPVMPLPVLK
jgi:hypothetical protein